MHIVGHFPVSLSFISSATDRINFIVAYSEIITVTNTSHVQELAYIPCVFEIPRIRVTEISINIGDIVELVPVPSCHCRCFYFKVVSVTATYESQRRDVIIGIIYRAAVSFILIQCT